MKGLIQGLLSLFPGGRWINDRLQTVVGDLRDLENNVAGKVDDWALIMSYLAAVERGDLRGRTVLEIGTGWYPTLPICFFLAGVRQVSTVDLKRHISETLTFRMLRALEAHLPRIVASSGRTAESVRRAYDRLMQTGKLPQLLEEAGIGYHAPADAAKLDWIPAGSFDMIYSNSVFEHIQPAVFPSLMQESWRVLKAHGLIVHAVACNDHYAHFDKNISFVNYLQFPERQWRWWNNALTYQNRLRAADFIRFAQNSGFRILHQACAVRPGTREALAQMHVAPEFGKYAIDDLAATTVDFVAEKPLPESLPLA